MNSFQCVRPAKTLTFEADSTMATMTAVTVQFLDKDAIKWEVITKDKAGKVYHHEQGTLTRLDGVPEKRAEEVAKPKPAELAVLDRWEGTWNAEWTDKPAEWTPQGGKQQGTATNSWVLDGKFLMNHGRDKEDKLTAIQMWAYDTESKEYSFWHFDPHSGGSRTRFNWNEDAKTMTGAAELDNGITQHSTIRWLDKDTCAWTNLAKGKDGKVYLDQQGKMTRRK